MTRKTPEQWVRLICPKSDYDGGPYDYEAEFVPRAAAIVRQCQDQAAQRTRKSLRQLTPPQASPPVVPNGPGPADAPTAEAAAESPESSAEAGSDHSSPG